MAPFFLVTMIGADRFWSAPKPAMHPSRRPAREPSQERCLGLRVLKPQVTDTSEGAGQKVPRGQKEPDMAPDRPHEQQHQLVMISPIAA